MWCKGSASFRAWRNRPECWTGSRRRPCGPRGSGWRGGLGSYRIVGERGRGPEKDTKKLLNHFVWQNQYLIITFIGLTTVWASWNDVTQLLIPSQKTFTKTFTPYTATITTQSVGCGAPNNGSALAQVSGPHGPYTFAWNNGQDASLDTVNQWSIK